MKITFIGGGSLRLIPILRGVLAECPQVFEDSELRFFDLNCDRAQAVIDVLKNAPEFSNVKKCNLVLPSTMDEALTDIDICYITMGIRKQPHNTLAAIESSQRGIISSDQLSLTGSFLGIQLGKIVWNIAERLAKLSPNALMLIFANPVAVYSSMIERFLGIKALGICGGFNNHRYDLTRIFGNEEYTHDCDVVAAGVNHFSFILRGTFKQEDIYGSLAPRLLNDSWKNIIPEENFILREGIDILYETYRQSNYLIFSTEMDGLYHASPQRIDVLQRRLTPDANLFDPIAAQQNSLKSIEENFNILFEAAKNTQQEGLYNHKLFATNTKDITIPILKAYAGIEKMRIVASGVNNGAISNMPNNAAVEYTMDIEGKKITPVENQFVPEPFYDVISKLSLSQTILGEAIAKHDHKLFAEALKVYPYCNNELVCKLFDIFSDSLDEEMLKARAFFE